MYSSKKGAIFLNRYSRFVIVGSYLIDLVSRQEEAETKLTLFILDSSISSKLFFLLVDPILLLEETYSNWVNKVQTIDIDQALFIQDRRVT